MVTTTEKKELDEEIGRALGGPAVHPEWYWWSGTNWSGWYEEAWRLPDDAKPVAWAGPAFSTDLASAWCVVEAMLGRRIGDLVVVDMDLSAAQYDPDEPRSYTCIVTLATPLDAPLEGSTTFTAAEATAETPALVICRAALKALA